MATETSEPTQIEPAGGQGAAAPSATPSARAWQARLASEGSPATPTAQLAMAVGTVVVVGAVAVLSRVSLVPPPPAARVQMLAALQPAKAPPVRPIAARVQPAVEPAAPPPVPAAPLQPAPPQPAAAAPQAAAAAAPALPTPTPAALPLVEPRAARHVEAAPKSHGKKTRRPPTSTRKRASTKPSDPAPAATRPPRSS